MKRIMIVEDNLRARRALKALISQQAGVKVTAEAPNGWEAINLIETKFPDVVLMDVHMPIMNGLDATRIIKRNWPQIQIVILTMYPDYHADALAAGADAFLLKGCLVEELMSLLHELEEWKAVNDREATGFFPLLIPPQIM